MPKSTPAVLHDNKEKDVEEPPIPPKPVVVSSPPPKEPRKEELIPQNYFDSLLDVKREVPKYGALQTHQMLTVHTDKELTAQLIDYLEKSKWSISNLARFMLKSYIHLEKSSMLTFFGRLQAEKLLESDKIEDLRYIRDELKRLVPPFLHQTAELATKFNRNDD